MKTPLLIALATASLATASARIWTSTDGRKIDAEFVALEDNKVVLNMKGREYRVPIERLSADDQSFANEQQAIADAPPAAAKGLKLAGQDVVAGKLQELAGTCHATLGGEPENCTQGRQGLALGLGRVRPLELDEGNASRDGIIRVAPVDRVARQLQPTTKRLADLHPLDVN
ncbi:SHD1 domain-containing protein [Sulfuriroseicoccus oceanibius]|uniref:SLA1 homology domain-containing protein n=1 Tax=Sulfuriroseicoccus oceanibius TaxID=2707525 RepID=A0A6B3LCV1_9BACT|nr:SHD1 domain-containing protein [Sulfuriroseicoccus oceanibius]QQL44778.1 hypothetical protein G3M56_012995 [Sulfuriroseicoccus oceanibius]